MKIEELIKWLLYSLAALLLLLTAGFTFRLSFGLSFILGEFMGLLNAIHDDLLELKKVNDENGRGNNEGIDGDGSH